MSTTEIAARAVHLQAIGQGSLALRLLEPGFTDAELGLDLAVGMARVLIADPTAVARIPRGAVRLETGHKIPEAELAFPVITEVITLTGGDHLGGLHQIWHRLSPAVRVDALAGLLAIVGSAVRHPERN